MHRPAARLIVIPAAARTRSLLLNAPGLHRSGMPHGNTSAVVSQRQSSAVADSGESAVLGPNRDSLAMTIAGEPLAVAFLRHTLAMCFSRHAMAAGLARHLVPLALLGTLLLRGDGAFGLLVLTDRRLLILRLLSFLPRGRRGLLALVLSEGGCGQ